MAFATKLKDILGKIGNILSSIGNVFSFLKPSLVLFSIFMMCYFVLVIALVATTNSRCLFSIDGVKGDCTTTTIVRIPFALAMIALVGVAYILAAFILLFYNKFFNKSLMKDLS
jgi:hypothetical protein